MIHSAAATAAAIEEGEGEEEDEAEETPANVIADSELRFSFSHLQSLPD